MGGTCDAVARFDGVAWTRYSIRADGIAVDGMGNIWLADERQLRILGRDGSEIIYSEADGLVGDPITVAFDVNGYAWVGSDKALNIWNGESWEQWYGGESGLEKSGSYISVRDIVFDERGGAWVATGSGAFYFGGGSWTKYDVTGQSV